MCIRGRLTAAWFIPRSRELAAISSFTTIRFLENVYAINGRCLPKILGVVERRSSYATGYWQLGTAFPFQGGFVRKYLGVLMAVAALGVMSYATRPEPSQVPVQPPAQLPAPDQAPAPTPTPSAPTPTAPVPAPPPAYPRFELFAGGSYAESGFFNAGHWAGLPGWDASIDANVTRWLGFIAEGGEFFGTSKIPTAVPPPFPTCS